MHDWQTVHHALKKISKDRAEMDANELRWLREAVKVRIWRPLGHVSMLDYMEREMGYAPHTARERLRLANALEGLPDLEGALSRGEICYSAAKELSRVVTRETEGTWLETTDGMSLRQIEELVSGRQPGDLPTDPSKPDLRTHRVTFELTGATFALLRAARDERSTW